MLENNISFYIFLGLIYLSVFIGVSEVVDSVQIKNKILSKIEARDQEISALVNSQENLVQSQQKLQTGVDIIVLDTDKLLAREVWGRHEIYIFCKKLEEINEKLGFKCPQIPDVNGDLEIKEE